jgi:hypothetical protein
MPKESKCIVRWRPNGDPVNDLLHNEIAWR